MVNVLFCGNEGVFDGILTCTLSILMRTASKEPFSFYIFTMELTDIDAKYTAITEKQISDYDEVIKSYNPENRVTPVRVDKYYKKLFAGCPNESAYCSPYTLIRLFADLVPEIPDKLLYLDADIFFNRDVHLLYDTDITGYEYAAARDHYGKYLLYPNYINAGVLLFNIAEAKKTELFKKARCWIRRKKLVFADQSALIRSTTRKKMLKQRFNDQKFLHKWTVVRHFSKRLFYLPFPHTDNIKQWDIERVHNVFKYHQFDDIYREYSKIKIRSKQ